MISKVNLNQFFKFFKTCFLLEINAYMSGSSDLHVVQHMLNASQTPEELRDELFCLLMKQLTDTPKE